MRYTYEIYNKVDDKLQRVHVGVRLEQVKLEANQVIVIHDNLKPHLGTSEFHTQDALDEWMEALARSQQWMDKSDRESIEHRAMVRGIDLDPHEVSLADNNLKTAAAAKKPRVSAVPPIALLAMGAAMQDGANKYGLFNWRDSAVTSTVFYDAIMRHLIAWYSGERNAPDSGVHHLAHVMAGCAIILDAELNSVLNDDRSKGHKVTPLEEKFFKSLQEVVMPTGKVD
jgi:hypothetical protein